MFQSPCLRFLSALLCPLTFIPDLSLALCRLVSDDSTSSASQLPPSESGTERNGGIKLEGIFVSKTGKRLLSNTHRHAHTPVWRLRDCVGARTPPLPKITSR